jgi:hypothetical protein
MSKFKNYLIRNEDTGEIIAEQYGTEQDVKDLYDKLNEERASNDWDSWCIYEERKWKK